MGRNWSHDVVVVGAGSAGLTAAGGLARLGLRVALIERHRTGGECLYTGCVPSKALLAAAREAQGARDAGRFGIRTGPVEVEFAAVRDHLAAAIAAIEPHDAPARFEAWGVEVVSGTARFAGDRTLAVGDRVLSAPRVVLAFGSRPRVPAVPGLDGVPFLTNESLFDLEELPGRLLILGGGPIGIEMAQAFRRLGSEVLVVARGRALPRDDRDAAAIVLARLRQEGVRIEEGAEAAAAWTRPDGVGLRLRDGREENGSHLLVAAGRVVDGRALDLAAGGVEADEDGVKVDRHRRTSARGVFAIGDCRQGPRFTHAAGHEGARIVTAIGLGLPAPVDYRALPRVTYTDPELAQVGVTAVEAARSGGAVAVEVQPFADNDRAVAEGCPEGFAKLVFRAGRTGKRWVGATVVGRGAGDLLLPAILGVGGGKATAWALSGAILPYPTRSEIIKATAFARFEPAIFSGPVRAWARLLARVRRL